MVSWPLVAFVLGCGVLVLGLGVLAEFRARRLLETGRLNALAVRLNAVAELGEGTALTAQSVSERVAKLEARLPDGVVRPERKLPAVMR